MARRAYPAGEFIVVVPQCAAPGIAFAARQVPPAKAYLLATGEIFEG